MLIIKLTKEFKYSVDGFTVRTCERGQHQMPERYAKIAEKAKYGVIVGKAPAASTEPEEGSESTEAPDNGDPIVVNGPQIIDLIGIGPVQTQALADLGIDSLHKLINAIDNPDAVKAIIDINGIHADNLAIYIDEAKALLSD